MNDNHKEDRDMKKLFWIGLTIAVLFAAGANMAYAQVIPEQACAAMALRDCHETCYGPFICDESSIVSTVDPVTRKCDWDFQCLGVTDEFGGKHPSQWPTDADCQQACMAGVGCDFGICVDAEVDGEGGCSYTCATIEDVVEVTWEPAPEQTLGGTIPMAEAYCSLKCKQYCSPAQCVDYDIWGKLPNLFCGGFECLL